ncbi:DUF3467 domain-containing protein [Hymenobacter montanus]|uniref:DUF3467 domain-containing protein n=1 Tax=Hymenobacter montanus TaxID=2771359 RepID=UPI001CC2B251|nr:DUF3467 domain-containing protein [Hymenobacter montanus]
MTETSYKTLLRSQLTKILTRMPSTLSEGEYANLAMIAYSNSEFVIDFIHK